MAPLANPVDPIGERPILNRQLPLAHAKTWLSKGWYDFRSTNMEASLLYGIVITTLSLLIVVGLFVFKLDHILLPALAAFMVVGPTLAVGLYEKSRRIESSERVSIGSMLFVKVEPKGHLFFIGLILTLWVLLWLRAGVLLYALFFGMHEFPSLGGALKLIFTDAAGYGLILTGSIFGALFAAFAFAISVISVPMLLNEDTDAFSAMGASIALVWNNLPVMLTWGVIVLGLFILSLFTGLLGLIVIYPVLGHATWHVYKDIRQSVDTPVFAPAISDVS